MKCKHMMVPRFTKYCLHLYLATQGHFAFALLTSLSEFPSKYLIKFDVMNLNS